MPSKLSGRESSKQREIQRLPECPQTSASCGWMVGCITLICQGEQAVYFCSPHGLAWTAPCHDNYSWGIFLCCGRRSHGSASCWYINCPGSEFPHCHRLPGRSEDCRWWRCWWVCRPACSVLSEPSSSCSRHCGCLLQFSDNQCVCSQNPGSLLLHWTAPAEPRGGRPNATAASKNLWWWSWWGCWIYRAEGRRGGYFKARSEFLQE